MGRSKNKVCRPNSYSKMMPYCQTWRFRRCGAGDTTRRLLPGNGTDKTFEPEDPLYFFTKINEKRTHYERYMNEKPQNKGAERPDSPAKKNNKGAKNQPEVLPSKHYQYINVFEPSQYGNCLKFITKVAFRQKKWGIMPLFWGFAGAGRRLGVRGNEQKVKYW
ncbi:MAG: hypothetical protein GXY32_06130 [Ruminococcaceae bacterium]|nr:hypothetical protein [Oscillospiraceae bacterium]